MNIHFFYDHSRDPRNPRFMMATDQEGRQHIDQLSSEQRQELQKRAKKAFEQPFCKQTKESPRGSCGKFIFLVDEFDTVGKITEGYHWINYLSAFDYYFQNKDFQTEEIIFLPQDGERGRRK